MDVEALVALLRKKYPAAKVVVREPATEIIGELEPGWAIAIIERSEPHFHLRTTEEYIVLEGTLAVSRAAEGLVLRDGEKCVIKPGQVHWARSVGEPAWIEVRSRPPWSAEDHILL